MEEMAANATEEILDEVIDEEVETEIADGDSDEEGELDSATDTLDDSEEPEIDEKRVETKAFSERLKKEREKILREAEEANTKRLDAIAKQRGFDTWQELEMTAEREKLEQMGIEDPEAFTQMMNELINKNPIVQKAQEVLKSQEEEQRNKFIENEIATISKFDPSIKSFDDILQLENYDEFEAKIKRGYTLSDAYKSLFFDKIVENRAENVSEKALKNIQSKSHMKTATGGTSKEIHVPADVLETYKRNTPGMSEADIRKHYAKFLQEK